MAVGADTQILDQPFDDGSLHALRETLEARAAEAGMPEGRAGDLVICVHELATNAVRHGAGSGRLRMWNQAGVLRCEVADGGSAGADPPASWPYQHGHGLWLARHLSEEMSVCSGPEGTVVTVEFPLPGAGPSGLTRDTRDGCTVLELTGDLDFRTAPQVVGTVRTLLAAGGAQLVLDLTGLEFWDSFGIVALITAQQAADDDAAAALVVTGLPDRFRRRLDDITFTR
ncbi:MAG: ATP-binding protein, partial [Streptosporangiaceae bacterium]